MSLAMTCLRALVGLLFLGAGVAKLATHEAWGRSFAHWGVPAPAVSVWLIAALEIVCGALFGLGILTRPVGLLLATVMIGAALTAGRTDGGLEIVVPIVVFAACVLLAWRADKISIVSPNRRPGVQ